MFINQVIIIGNLTKKPELKNSNGKNLTGLSIAVNSTYVDKQTGEKVESVEFISVTVFGKTAENCAMYLEKGQKVFVEGKIKNRVEESENGKRYHTGIIAQHVQFGPKPQTTQTYENQPKVENTNETTQSRFKYPEEEINPDDIPF